MLNFRKEKRVPKNKVPPYIVKIKKEKRVPKNKVPPYGDIYFY